MGRRRVVEAVGVLDLELPIATEFVDTALPSTSDS